MNLCLEPATLAVSANHTGHFLGSGEIQYGWRVTCHRTK